MRSLLHCKQPPLLWAARDEKEQSYSGTPGIVLMKCSNAQEFVSAFIDGELVGEAQQAARAHIIRCPACQALADDYRAMGRQVAGGYEPAPSDLADKIQNRIALEDVAAPTDRWSSLRRLMLQAAVLLLVSGLSALTSWYLTDRAAVRERVERDIVASHVRALMQDRPVQVASSERHTVKPWFAGKVDYAPPVAEFAEQGFPLAGARVDYVGDRRVAVLVYMRRLHVINVFVWPSANPPVAQPHIVALRGYNGLTWTSGGMTHWAISDLNLEELKQFQALLR